MDRKKLLLILGVAGGLLLIACISAIVFGVRGLRAKEQPTPVEIPELTLCDVNASGLCVLSFGADYLNQMVISFQLPDEDYPSFYVRVDHSGASQVYRCQTLEEFPTTVTCTGPRTPLGEAIEIWVYAVQWDRLIAGGKIIVAAIALPTPGSMLVMGSGTPGTEIPTTPSTPRTPGTPGTPGTLPTPFPSRTPTPRPGYTGR